jgi:hypothetical protein
MVMVAMAMRQQVHTFVMLDDPQNVVNEFILPGFLSLLSADPVQSPVTCDTARNTLVMLEEATGERAPNVKRRPE